eukprot:GHVQ01001158.1.p1 GENE.GHVQ01001158.1~~GHVQ01001158.1.p1  ORF type:complete len:612 (-),score=134.24 GHVQ01001158.1:508-2343(-)
MKLKKVSQRQPLARKYTIEKKVRAHTRKMRKVARKNSDLIRRRAKDTKASLSIPNNYPFKADLLRNLQLKKERLQAEKEAQRKAIRALRLKKTSSNITKKKKGEEEGWKDEGDREGGDVDMGSEEGGKEGSEAVTDVEQRRRDACAYADMLTNASRQQHVYEGPKTTEHKRTDNGMITTAVTTTSKNPGTNTYFAVTHTTAQPLPHTAAQLSIEGYIDDLMHGSSPRSKKHKGRSVPHGGVGSSRVNGAAQQHMKQLRDLINASDVVVCVLDARDPLGCRSEKLERYLLGKGKRVVLLLNKIDLVPSEALESWLKYLRRSHPTIPFKSVCGNTSRVCHSTVPASNAPDGLKKNHSQVLGASQLIQLIKNYSRTTSSPSDDFSLSELPTTTPPPPVMNAMDVDDTPQDNPHNNTTNSTTNNTTAVNKGGTSSSSSSSRLSSITVGVIGYPNVGKSSVINSLKRSVGSAATGGVAGVTRQLQRFMLDKTVCLIDSPGVVLCGEDDDPSMVLRNAVNVSKVKDVELVVERLLERCPKEQLMQFYKVDAFSNTQEFLANFARSRGKLSKGGVPNISAAARTAIDEWTSGKVPYYCMPPQIEYVDELASSSIVPHL